MKRILRAGLGLVVLLAAVGALAACSVGGPEKGDCVAKSEDTYEAADCATASLRVLDALDGFSADCVDVAGVTERFSDSRESRTLCIGPRDVDPATAINAARDGDCVAGGAGGSDARRVDCADPTAESVVLKRIEDASTIGISEPCSDVPGSNSNYTWDMVSSGDSPGAMPSLDGLGVDLLFCLGPVGVDPNSSPDLAQAGDCLAETAGDPGYAKVDCGAPDAAFRVVERSDGGFLPLEIVCSDADGATSGIQRSSGLEGYTLCLAPN